ncbi:class I SAM-dependent methyltransferase [Streptomyces sp. NBC_01142]|uniref:class I SAM-dependent methyltransferase n=1 Tax=Streptomyces sp. NBC_01142 TaxID=2975865 RepID=UPI00224CB48A|nr:class I SAM-dependent methyltransferase [Streptomyces sp. NBC_01142]MCX4824582.1 class I SAM-dependent methyltransferase [Streptomyces sp. NBC_01142]
MSEETADTAGLAQDEEIYSGDFYSDIEEGILSSARVIVPMVSKIAAPESVLDLGCGTGAWLAEFARHGTGRISGFDGPWVDVERLHIPRERFTALDISDLGQPPASHDLAVCLEVAEHLPDSSSEQLVSYLTAAAPTILFSAAVPGQGGVGHVNEQWLDYWAEKFTRRGYRLHDVIRSQVWDNEDVEPWYAQNMVLFADGSVPAGRFEESPGSPLPMRVVHPRVFHNSLEAWA